MEGVNADAVHEDGNEPLTLDESDFTGREQDSHTASNGNVPDISRSNSKLVFTTKGDRLSVTFVTAQLEVNYSRLSMDPYCVMKVGSEELKTEKCRKGSTNPKWGQRLTCEVPPSVSFVFIEIFDQRLLSKDFKIAWTSIPIKHLLKNDEVAAWYDLSGHQGLNKEGRLQLITKYTPNASGLVPEQILMSSPTMGADTSEQQEDSDSKASSDEEESLDSTDSSVPTNTLKPSAEQFNSDHLKITCVEAGSGHSLVEPNASGLAPEQILMSSPTMGADTSEQQEDSDSKASSDEEESLDSTDSSVPTNPLKPSVEQFNSDHLKITCVEARLNRNYGLVSMDPYCVIRIGAKTLETPVCRGSGTSPRWNETLECHLSPGTCVISVEIFDSKRLMADQKIAWTTIFLKDIKHNLGQDITKQYPLSGPQGFEKEGHIELITCYEDVSEYGDDGDMVRLDNITTLVNVTRRRLTDFTNHVPKKLNIKIVGRCDKGKTSVGNTMMGQECFFQDRSGNQRTVLLAKLVKDGFEINIMDTPNFLDEREEMSVGQKKMEILKTAMDFPDGIDLLLIVCRGDIRLGDEDKILPEIEKIYDQSVYDQALLVLTHAKDFLQVGTLQEALKAKRDLWNVCKRVHGRVIALENNQEVLSDVTMEDQQTQLLRTVLEVVRLGNGKQCRNKWNIEVVNQTHERGEKQRRIVATYDKIFDHIVKTICDKSEREMCEILKTRAFVIENDFLRENDVLQDQNIIRQCTEWCLKDLETFINLILTEKRFDQNSNDGHRDENETNHDSIVMYKRRSLRSAEAITQNRKHLMGLFNIEVEKSVRNLLRCKELSEIDDIMRMVENNVIPSDLKQAILNSLPDSYKSDVWQTDVHYLSVLTLREYLEIKTKVLNALAI